MLAAATAFFTSLLETTEGQILPNNNNLGTAFR
jgi:hypothetical protein